ncbi:MAG: hypothetical protein RL417_2250 [Pseudomonadota bacterium]|jgi:hypothetical protein
MRFPFFALIAMLGYWTLTALQMDRFADDPGVGWHLMTGEMIMEDRAVPRFDPFLATPTPRPWIADQWLSDLCLAALNAVGGGSHGMPLLYGTLTAIFLLTFMGTTFAAALRYSQSPLAAGAAAFLALKLSSIHFILRPVIFGFFLYAIMMYLLWEIVRKVRAGEALPFSLTAPLLLITLLWVNLHPSFPLGIIVLALAIVGLLYDIALIERKPLRIGHFIHLGALLLCMVAATLINPYGVDLLRQVFGLVGSDFFMNLNSEWKAIDPRSGEGQLFFTVIVIIILGAFLAPNRVRSIRFPELFILGFLAISTLKSVRFLPFFAIAAAPLIAQSIRSVLTLELLMRLPAYRRLGAITQSFDARQRGTGIPYTIILTLLAALPVVMGYRTGAIPGYGGAIGISDADYPFDGVTALKTLITDKKLEPPVVVAASPDWGGFITLTGKNVLKPVIDDRNSLLGEAPYRDYLKSTAIGGDIHGYMARVGAQFLLVRSEDPLAIYLRDTKRLNEAFRGPVSSIFQIP